MAKTGTELLAQMRQHLARLDEITDAREMMTNSSTVARQMRDTFDQLDCHLAGGGTLPVEWADSTTEALINPPN